MKLYCVHHGIVEKAYQGCYNGWNNITLSEEGHQQVKESAMMLSHNRFDALYCSPLTRCKQSLEHFQSHCTLPEVAFDERLKEKGWGRCEGMHYDDICKQFGIEYQEFDQWIRDMGGESKEAFEARVYDFYEMLQTLPHRKVLIITHSGVIRMLHALHTKIPFIDSFKLEVPDGGIITFRL